MPWMKLHGFEVIAIGAVGDSAGYSLLTRGRLDLPKCELRREQGSKPCPMFEDPGLAIGTTNRFCRCLG